MFASNIGLKNRLGTNTRGKKDEKDTHDALQSDFYGPPTMNKVNIGVQSRNAVPKGNFTMLGVCTDDHFFKYARPSTIGLQ